MTGKRGPKEIQITPEMTGKVCDAIEKYGTLAMAEHRKAIPHTRNTIYQLMRKDKKFKKSIETARAIGYENLVDETLIIAFEGHGDILGEDKFGRDVINNECVQRSKLKIETILKRVSMANPARYRDNYHKAETRPQPIPGLADAKTNKDRVDVLFKAVGNGVISPERAASLASICNFQSQNDEFVKMAQEQREIKELLGSKSE